MNLGIQNYLKKRGAVVHQVLAREQIHYLATGDRVLYDKDDCTIVDIKKNISYLGKNPIPASVDLDRYGCYQTENRLASLC